MDIVNTHLKIALCIFWLHILLFELMFLQEVESESDSKDNTPSKDWPSDGCITFKKVKMKYRENLPPALKSVTFDVLPKEKIGIVGRSGSGMFN